MRNQQIDILKGLAIILMVLGHCAPSTHFIYLFHMALFLISGGFCFKNSYSESSTNYINYLTKKLKTLWLPYVIWNSIFLALNNTFVKLHIYDTTSLQTTSEIIHKIFKGFIFKSGTQIGGAFWFLIMYFYITVFYGTIEFLISKLKLKQHGIFIQTIISGILLYIGYYCCMNELHFPHYMDRVFSCYSLFHLGVILKNTKINFPAGIRPLLIPITYIMLCFCDRMGRIALNLNSYENPFFLLSTSLLGWILIYEISYYLQKIKYLNKLLILIGHNTLPIMILHFLSFKLGNLIVALIQNKPLTLIKIFPVLTSSGYWCVFYTFIGIALPLILSLSYKKIVNYFSLKVTKTN